MIRKFSKHRLLGQRHQGYGVTRRAKSIFCILIPFLFLSLSQSILPFPLLCIPVHLSVTI